MKLKIKCYVKPVKTPKTAFYSRFTFIPFFDSDTNVKDDRLFSVKFTKDVPEHVIPNVSSVLICEDKNVSISFDKEQVWISRIEDVTAMERPVTDLSQYFEVIDESKAK